MVYWYYNCALIPHVILYLISYTYYKDNSIPVKIRQQFNAPIYTDNYVIQRILIYNTKLICDMKLCFHVILCMHTGLKLKKKM